MSKLADTPKTEPIASSMGAMAEPDRSIECWLTDMDGVLVHEGRAIPGAQEFLERLVARERRFLVLTNNSIYTPRDLRARLSLAGLNIPEESIWTSALATAQFLVEQKPDGSAYVIGEAGLTTALHEVGYVMTDTDPDYVVLGETRTYSFEAITRAIRLIVDGARFIVTNPDPTGPSAEGPLPATGAVAALITRATERDPYYVGKPNPMMFRSALNRIRSDYVVLGETRTYSFEAITRAIRLIVDGARFIVTNPDPTGPSAEGPLPATGAVAALITRATERDPYYVGKPNPMMFRSALNRI